MNDLLVNEISAHTENKIQADLSRECSLSKAVGRVFKLKAVGNSNQEVADLLFRSIKTINTQSSQYLHEMDCKNTQEAVAKAIAEGWLTFKYITKTLTLLVCISSSILTTDSDIKRVKAARTHHIHRKIELT